MNRFFEEYKLPILCGAIGLVIALLLITVGFFKTLLLFLITFLGTAFGFYIKNDPRWDNFFKR